MKRFTQHALFWPATTLLLLLAVSAIFNPRRLHFTGVPSSSFVFIGLRNAST